MRVAEVNELSAGTQCGLRVVRADAAGLLVSAKHVADFSVDQVPGVPAHPRQPLPEQLRRLALANQREDQGPRRRSR